MRPPECRDPPSLVGDNRHLLQCHRYIELNSLRARVVADPADYHGSSHRHHALSVSDPLLTPHPAMLVLGRDPEERRQNYRERVMEAVDPEEADAIRKYLQHQQIYGPDRFRKAIEAQLRRRIGPKRIAGRERRSPNPQTFWKVDCDPCFPCFRFFAVHLRGSA